MENKISILHLEDQEADSILIKAFINKGFSAFDYYVTDDEEGFIRLLKEQRFDVILSDYLLPGYSGMDALIECKNRCPETPFIFVTGNMGEDAAIQSLLKGATDYVLKSKMERLIPAINRALYEAELRHDRINSDIALRDSEERYRGLLMNLNAGVIVHAPDSSIIMSNPKAEELLGLTEDQLKGKMAFDPHWSFLYEDYQELPVESYPVSQIIKTKKPIKDFRLGVYRPNLKDIVWLTVNGSPVMDGNDEISEIVISFLDITVRKKAEDALLKEQYLMEALMNNIPDHLYFKDLDSKFMRISKSNNESFRISNSSEAIGKSDFDFFTEEHARAAFRDEQEIIRTGLPLFKEEKETWADRPDTWAASTKLPLRDKDGKIIGTFGISRDITERKRFEEELLRAKELAEASDRLKNAFIRHIGHEIKTPLQGILGYGPMLADLSHSKEDREEFLRMVNESSDRLVTTVTKLMDISLIVSGTQEVKISSVAPRKLLQDIHQKLNPHCQEKKLSLIIAGNEINDQFSINTDREILFKVLFHLVDNAIKFTRQGTVTMGYRQTQEMLEFFVRDTGIGIDEETQKRIYEPFMQKEFELNRSHEGNGLGLSIAKGFVELLGGRIWVDSVKNAGSTFTFTIPVGC
jgi:PAS domain S-box-containing protein